MQNKIKDQIAKNQQIINANKGKTDQISHNNSSSASQKVETGQNMLNTYQNLVNNRINSKNEAYISSQKALQSTANSLKTQGLYGSGYGETISANIGGMYSNNLQSANNSFGTNTTNAMNTYQQQLNGLDVSNQQNNTAAQENINNSMASIYEGLISNSKTKEEAQQAYDKAIASGVNGAYLDALTATKENVVGSYDKNELFKNYGVENVDETFTFDSLISSGKYKGVIGSNNSLNMLNDLKSSGYKFSNGMTLDINPGSGTNNYVYYNGRFYKSSDEGNADIGYKNYKQTITKQTVKGR